MLLHLIESYRRRYVIGLIVLTVMLLVTLIVTKFFIPDESALVSQRFLTVKVISANAPDSSSTSQVVGNRTMVTVQLPDGKQAVVPFQYSQPKTGELVKVKVKLFENGKQRVVAADI